MAATARHLGPPAHGITTRHTPGPHACDVTSHAPSCGDLGQVSWRPRRTGMSQGPEDRVSLEPGQGFHTSGVPPNAWGSTPRGATQCHLIETPACVKAAAGGTSKHDLGARPIGPPVTLCSQPCSLWPCCPLAQCRTLSAPRAGAWNPLLPSPEPPTGSGRRAASGVGPGVCQARLRHDPYLPACWGLLLMRMSVSTQLCAE